MKFLMGVVVGVVGVVLVALAGDPRRKRYDTTSLDRQSRRFDDEMDVVQGADPRTVTERWTRLDDYDEGVWKPTVTFKVRSN